MITPESPELDTGEPQAVPPNGNGGESGLMKRSRRRQPRAQKHHQEQDSRRGPNVESICPPPVSTLHPRPPTTFQETAIDNLVEKSRSVFPSSRAFRVPVSYQLVRSPRALKGSRKLSKALTMRMSSFLLPRDSGTSGGLRC